MRDLASLDETNPRARGRFAKSGSTRGQQRQIPSESGGQVCTAHGASLSTHAELERESAYMTAAAKTRKRLGEFISSTLPDTEYLKRKTDLILANVKPNERGCLEFQGYRHPKKGYGSIGMKDGKNIATHRVVYLGMRSRSQTDGTFVIPATIHRVVTLFTYLRRLAWPILSICATRAGIDRLRRPCARKGTNHTPENTLICSRGWRSCRECNRQRCRETWLDRERKKAESFQSGKPGESR